MSRFIKKGTLEELSIFLRYNYLQSYISNGGSKIKFVTGSEKSGKSAFLALTEKEAEAAGFKVVHLSARGVPMFDFKDLYSSIVTRVGLPEILSRCKDKVILSLDYDPKEIPEGKDFMEYLASIDEGDALTRRAIRKKIESMFLSNPYFDSNFSLACSMIVGSMLGHPKLDDISLSTIYSYLAAEKELKMSAIRLVGLAPKKINKTNARLMLNSLVEVILLSGYEGLAIFIDDFDAILNRSGLDAIHYTKMRREDAYESIRELIDSIDAMHNVFFLFAFHRVLLDDENAGLKSYQALWMRIQNEIVGERFNCFADVLDLDRYGELFFDASDLRAIYESLADAYRNPKNGIAISDEELLRLKEKSKKGSLGIMGLLEGELLERMKGNVGNSGGEADE